MKYEIKLRIDKNVEVIYDAVFLKEAIYSNENALHWHNECLEQGRRGEPLSEILINMTKMVIELERAENDTKH